MAVHPITQLAPLYDTYWSTLVVTREGAALEAADRLLHDRKVYDNIAAESGVISLWQMPTNEREDGGRLDRYFGNGDPLSRPTVNVPAHRGPFPDYRAGALDAIRYDGIDRAFRGRPAGVSMAALLIYEWISWNGWGYDPHGIRSPYAFGGTNLQQRGKYDADGHYNPGLMDTQLGTCAIAWALLKLAPDLAPPGLELPGGGIKEDSPPEELVHTPPPITVGGSHHDAEWLQAALNRVAETSLAMRAQLMVQGAPAAAQLVVDGNVGRMTRLFVRAFERSNGLAIDRGYSGPQVLGALDDLLGSGWSPPTTGGNA